MMKMPVVVTVCLLLGSVINIALALVCSVTVQRDLTAARENDRMGSFMASWTTRRATVHDTWNLRVQSRFGAARIIATNGAYVDVPSSVVPTGFFPGWSSIESLPEVHTNVDLYGFIENAYGWPMPSLWHSWTGMSDAQSLEQTYEGSFSLGDFHLPIRPAWSGMFINTIFFASMVYVLARIRGLIRRYGRRARGRCPGCGESICSTDGRLCDACGHSVTWLGA